MSTMENQEIIDMSAFYREELGGLNDFKNFLYVAWMNIPSIGVEPTDLQYDIANYLQAPKKRNSIVMAYRGTGKSYITAAFVVWLLLLNPELKIMVLSASQQKAKDFAVLVRNLIRSLEFCKHLEPNKDQRDSALSFDVGAATVAKDPSVAVYGIGGQITGSRADIIIADDIETPDNSANIVAREKLLAKFNEVMSIIKPSRDGMVTQVKILGTPQTQQSIYFELEKQDFQIQIWPARYPQNPESYAGRLAQSLWDNLKEDPYLRGQPTNPKMHDDADLLSREVGRSAYFQLQFMLDPTLSDEAKYPLKLRDFILMDTDNDEAPVSVVHSALDDFRYKDGDVPVVGFNRDRWQRPFRKSDTWEKYESKILVVDPAGGNDETAYVVLGRLRGNFYLLDVGGFKGGSKKTLESLALTAKNYNVNEVVVERNYGASVDDDGNKTSAFIELLKPEVWKTHPCSFVAVHNTGQKEKRIISILEPVLGAHRLIVSPLVVQKDYNSGKYESLGEGDSSAAYQLFYQLTHITQDRNSLVHDDRVDCLAMGIDHFVRSLKTNTELNEKQAAEEAAERRVQEIIERRERSALMYKRQTAWHETNETGFWFENL